MLSISFFKGCVKNIYIFLSAVEFTEEGSSCWWCVELRLTAGLYWLQAALFYHSLVYYLASLLVHYSRCTGGADCWALFTVQVALYWVPGGGGNYANRDHTRGGQHWYIGSPRSGYTQMDWSCEFFLPLNFILCHIFFHLNFLYTQL